MRPTSPPAPSPASRTDTAERPVTGITARIAFYHGGRLLRCDRPEPPALEPAAPLRDRVHAQMAAARDCVLDAARTYRITADSTLVIQAEIALDATASRHTHNAAAPRSVLGHDWIPIWATRFTRTDNRQLFEAVMVRLRAYLAPDTQSPPAPPLSSAA